MMSSFTSRPSEIELCMLRFRDDVSGKDERLCACVLRMQEAWCIRTGWRAAPPDGMHDALVQISVLRSKMVLAQRVLYLSHTFCAYVL